MFSQKARKRFGQHWLRSEKNTPQNSGSGGGYSSGLCAGNWSRYRSINPLAVAPGSSGSGGGKWIGICAENLQTSFAKEETFKLIQGDILELDIQAALEQDKEYNFGLPNKVVANIPYYITGPILEKLLGTIANPNPAPYDSIVLLVQKEVAERLYAKLGQLEPLCALSVRVQYLADCEQICQVPAKAFQPPPKVDSAVVRLRPRLPQVVAQNPDHLDQLVKLGFSSKRKMLRNNLKAVMDRDVLTQLMSDLAIPETARAEDSQR